MLRPGSFSTCLSRQEARFFHRDEWGWCVFTFLRGMGIIFFFLPPGVTCNKEDEDLTRDFRANAEEASLALCVS